VLEDQEQAKRKGSSGCADSEIPGSSHEQNAFHDKLTRLCPFHKIFARTPEWHPHFLVADRRWAQKLRDLDVKLLGGLGY
jgi:hypothetical protein